MQPFKINEKIAALINEHGYEAKIVGHKIIPGFKDEIELDTWVYPDEFNSGVKTRFDIGVEFKTGTVLYESFGDFGENLDDSTKNNIQNFSASSFHVFLDAFNDTINFCDKEQWQISGKVYDVYIGNFNVKSYAKNVNYIPGNLFETIEDIIINSVLNEAYYFVRFYHAINQNMSIATEFMINNINIDSAEKRLGNLNWSKSEEFYSVRNFIILKLV